MNQSITSPNSDYFDDLPPSIFFSGMVVAFLLVTLMLALHYQQRTLVIFSILLLLLAFSLRIWGRLSPRHVRYLATVDRDRVFPGEAVSLEIQIENDKFLPVIVRLSLRIAGLSTGGGDDLMTGNAGLLWHQKVRFNRTLVPTRRGCYRLGAPRLVTGDFFGFFPRLKEVRQPVDIVVFPRWVPIKPVPILKRIMFGKSAAASPVQDPIYVLGTTDYQDLSPARNIHWKASARHSRLQEKVFEPTEQEKLLFVFEVDGFHQEQAETAFERTIEAIAALAAALIAQHHAVGFLTNGAMVGGMPEYLALRGGTRQLATLLERLARMELKTSGRMVDLLSNQRCFPVGSSCLYFSLRPAEGVSVLHRKRIPVVNIVAEGDDGASASSGGSMAGVRFCPLSSVRLGG